MRAPIVPSPRLHRAQALWAAAGCVLLAANAFAQAAPSPPTAQAPAPPVVTSPAPAAAATPTLPNTQALASDDPLLIPLPPAKQQLSNWREALTLVRSQSTSLAISRARVLEAQALSRDALANALPIVTAVGTVNHHLIYGTGTNISSSGIATNVTIPDPGTSWRGGVSLRQPLFAYKSWYDVGTSKERARAAEHNTANTERQILAAVAQTLVDLVTAERLAEISRQGLGSALATLSLTERRANLGAASRLDVLRAEHNASLSRAQAISAREAVLRAREALGMALGSPEGWGVPHQIELGQLAQDARQLCSTVASVTERADVRAAEVNAHAAKRDQKSALYDTLPTLDLVSDVTYSNQNFSPNNKPVQWTVGAVLTLPLYDGGSRYAARERAGATAEIARQELTQVQRQARVEVQQATRGVQVAQANLQVSVKTRDLTKETARLAQVAFLNGSGTSFDLVDTEQQYRQAELDLAIKELEVVRAHIIALLAQANCNI